MNLSSFIAGSARRPVAVGFDEEDSEVIRVRGEVPEEVGGRRSGDVGGRGGIADCHIGVSPVGGGDEAAVGPGRSRDPGEGATGAKVGDRLPGADLEGSVVASGFVAEVGDAGVVGRGGGEVRGAPWGRLRGWRSGWRRRR